MTVVPDHTAAVAVTPEIATVRDDPVLPAAATAALPKTVTLVVATLVPSAPTPAVPEIGIVRGTATDPTTPGAPGSPPIATRLE
jgi:hypothetical protein